VAAAAAAAGWKSSSKQVSWKAFNAVDWQYILRLHMYNPSSAVANPYATRVTEDQAFAKQHTLLLSVCKCLLLLLAEVQVNG
jgi:hypothetical protein